jgi:hypothetical protein
MTKIRALLEQLRQRLGAWWYRLGLRLFPRHVDQVLDIPVDANAFIILHRFAGVPTVIHRSADWSIAVADWTLFVNQRDRFPGELQLWKNGKLRDSREAING